MNALVFYTGKEDYAISERTITIPFEFILGDQENGTFCANIALIHDSKVEEEERFSVSLISRSDSNVQFPDRNATVTIRDRDSKTNFPDQNIAIDISYVSM